jgi:5'-methylthioinosine phosphorylase
MIMKAAGDSNSAAPVAIIGGSGFYRFAPGNAGTDDSTVSVATPFADTPETVYAEQTGSGQIWFIPRHGEAHTIAPHEINYRAKLWALHKLGTRVAIAVNAVGGISTAMQTGTLVLPDQLIDYTWGRQHTYVEGNHRFAAHVDFTEPYDAGLARVLSDAAATAGLAIVKGGVYGCTQGPRLETAAEIRKLAADGCDFVGMTGMPEAALARELGIRYCCVALVVNRAAGLESRQISLDDIRRELAVGVLRIRQLLDKAMPELFAQAAGQS